MLALTIFSILILLILLMIFVEYRNEKKYQAKRRAESPKTRTPRKRLRVRKVVPKPEVKSEPTPEPEPEPVPIFEPKVEVKVPKETKHLPEANYPKFSHARLVDMGLSDEEAKEFVAELIPQIEEEIPLIQVALQNGDFHKIERLTHGIKGSATNLGTGGVSDLLADYNTYVKTGIDMDIAKAYLDHLVYYTSELKEQYS